MNETTVRVKTSDVYSPQEIEEFRQKILKIKSDAELFIKEQKTNINSEELVGDDDRKQRASMDAAAQPVYDDCIKRSEKTIQNCENALLRIKYNTYGICHKTGEVIPKNVMHASLFRTVKDLKD